jgi:hypothetical protein
VEEKRKLKVAPEIQGRALPLFVRPMALQKPAGLPLVPKSQPPVPERFGGAEMYRKF